MFVVSCNVHKTNDIIKCLQYFLGFHQAEKKTEMFYFSELFIQQETRKKCNFSPLAACLAKGQSCTRLSFGANKIPPPLSASEAQRVDSEENNNNNPIQTATMFATHVDRLCLVACWLRQLWRSHP